MFSVWAEERNLGERLKSACIVVLLLAVLLLQAGRGRAQEAVAPDNRSAGSIAEEAGNPIDAFFAEAVAGGTGIEEDERLSNIYLDCWEKELGHAFGLVKGSGEKVSLGEVYHEEAVDTFWRFAEAEAWMEAYLGESRPGSSPITARKAIAKAQLLRSQALRIYELLKEDQAGGGVWDGQYAFHQDETITALAECGVAADP